MNMEDIRNAQIEFAKEKGGIDTEPLKTSFEWSAQVERFHEVLKEFMTLLSGQPPARFKILRALFLNSKGCLKPADLAVISGLTRATTSHNIDRLEKDKLITRRIDKKDKRSVYIRLTQKGVELMDEVLTDYLGTLSRISSNTAPFMTSASISRLKNYNQSLKEEISSRLESGKKK